MVILYASPSRFTNMENTELTKNARKILEERYLRRDEDGTVVETPEEAFERVAEAIAKVNEDYYDDDRTFEEEKEEFYEALIALDFIPNSPTLMNAGLELGQLSACFVLSPLDNMDSIFQQVKNAAKIFQSGGGVGYTFSRLRPRGDMVKSTGGIASGPVSFMKVYDEMCNTIKQGGRRRGAQMAVLSVQHPDIEEFIEAKDEEGELENFNISVALTEEFMEAVGEGEEYPLINPRSQEVVGHLDARKIYDKIVNQAWKNGEPGILFLDRINEDNPFDVEEYPEHYIDATNPCGEQPLEDFEACNLGHINLSHCVDDGEIDWDKLEDLTDMAVRFLDNVIDASDFPDVEGYEGEEDAITKKVKENRKIGLGVMGWHHMLMKLGIPYDSEEAVDKAGEVMGFIQQKSKEVSSRIAEERGKFSTWDESEYEKPMRNATTTTIAPTGCVKTDTLISTESGLEEIQGFQGTRIDDRWSETKISKVESDEGTVEAVRHFDNGKAVVEKIVTEEGFEVTATPDHKFRVVDEESGYSWKETQDIDEKDRIVLKRNTLKEEYRPVKLGTSEHENTGETLKLPEEMTEELAEFLGYYMGDGYVHEDVGVKLIVASHQEELEHHLKNLGEKVFGVEPTIEDKGSKKMLCFGGRHLPRYFKDNGWMKEKGNKGEGAASIPEQVMRSGRKPAKAFLRGLFEADSSRKVELSTASKKLSKQVQILLLSLGIVFKRERRSAEVLGDDHHGEKDRYVVRGLNKSEDNKFLNQVGFITKAPEQELELTPQSFKNDDFPPVMVEELIALAVFNDLNPELKHRVRQSRYQVLTKRTAEKVVENTEEEDLMVKRFIENDFFLGTVKEKEKGTARTHDLEVPENNTYIANGFVSHNTTSMIADTSGGIEPIFAVSYVKNVLDGESLVMPDAAFEEMARERGIHSQELMEKIAETGSVANIEEVPEDMKDIFKTALEITPEWHIRMQAAFQEHVDNAISKTVNFPKDASKEDIKEVYDLAYELKCKGVTVYRSGSRQEQVMEVEGEEKEGEEESVKEAERRPRKRPATIEGTTRKITTGYGGLYVTINEDEHGMFEVFSQIGRAGGFTQSFTESLARLISLCLRSGIPTEEIIEQLEGIRSPEIAFEQGEKILSIPDAMAKAMKWHKEGRKITEQAQLPTDGQEMNSAVKEMVSKGMNPACPECGSMLTLTEGCRTCPNCGYSQC